MDPISLKKDTANGQVFDSDRYNLDQTAVEEAINKIIDSTVDGDSGADNVKMTPIPAVHPTNNTVQSIVEGVVAWAASQLSAAVLAGISDNSITDVKMAADTKIGSLAALTTSVKTSIQAAINSHVIDYVLQTPYGGVTTGSANTYVLAAPSIAALTAGMAVSCKINVDSSGASTLNWDGKGAKAIKKANGTDMTYLKNGGIYTLRYDGTNFILQGEGASGDMVASDLILGKTGTSDAGEITGTLALDGDVAVGDVVSGKRFYKDDPKTKLTGTLVLDGDSAVGDVISGKTFYNTDPKTKLTGTGANLKRYATGTGVTDVNGKLTVTGLAFQPRIVHTKLADNSGSIYMIYRDASVNENFVPLTGTKSTCSMSGSGFESTTGYSEATVRYEVWE